MFFSIFIPSLLGHRPGHSGGEEITDLPPPKSSSPPSLSIDHRCRKQLTYSSKENALLCWLTIRSKRHTHERLLCTSHTHTCFSAALPRLFFDAHPHPPLSSSLPTERSHYIPLSFPNKQPHLKRRVASRKQQTGRRPTFHYEIFQNNNNNNKACCSSLIYKWK